MTKESVPVKGDRLSDGFPSVEKIVKCTFGATAGEVTADTQAVFGLITMPQYAQVMDVGFMVDLAFTAAVTLTLGDTDAAAGWAAAADIGATVTDTGITWASRYIQSSANDCGCAYALAPPLYSTAGKDINVTVAGANPATGKMSVYVKYHMAYGQKHF